MGFISTVVVMNDYLHEIGQDKDFGYKLERAVLSLSIHKQVCFAHSAMAIETHHNSGCIPVLVGHSQGIPLSVSVGMNPGEDPEISLLKRLADKHGYLLRAKPVRRGS